jgi:NAD(P)-dependent dehydrogenase (short-subunit alcohol dehydrogenase family)
LWRAQAKEGLAVSGRIINTSSGAGLLGSVGQSNYSAAKGAILSLTLVQAAELQRYGVTANAIAPQARTGMTEEVFAEMMKVPEDGGFDAYHPDNVAPLVVWLASTVSHAVTGQCFEIFGGKLSIADGWRTGPEKDKQARWLAEELGDAIEDLMASAVPAQPVYGS